MQIWEEVMHRWSGPVAVSKGFVPLMVPSVDGRHIEGLLFRKKFVRISKALRHCEKVGVFESSAIRTTPDSEAISSEGAMLTKRKLDSTDSETDDASVSSGESKRLKKASRTAKKDSKKPSKKCKTSDVKARGRSETRGRSEKVDVSSSSESLDDTDDQASTSPIRKKKIRSKSKSRKQKRYEVRLFGITLCIRCNHDNSSL
jgi:hypothetical protein